MITSDWQSFFAGLSAFSGVVFALTLAARQITVAKAVEESLARNRTRLYDSLSTTYELAAAALLAVLWIARHTVVGAGAAAVFAALGIASYGVYIRKFVAMSRREYVGKLGWLFLVITVIPLAALTWSAVYMWLTFAGVTIPTDWFAVALLWLIFSGTAQAVLWYRSSWEHEGVTRGSDGDVAVEPNAVPPKSA